MVKIVDMTSALQQVRESDAYDNQRYMMKKYMGQILARPDNSNNKDGKDHVYAPNAKIAKQLYSQGKKVYRESSDGYIVKFANSKGAKIASAWYKDEKSAKEALASIKKNGGNGIISKGKMNEDEKNLEETKVYRVSHPSKKTAEVEGDNENDAIQRYKRYHKLGSTSGIKATLRKQSPYPSFTSKIPTHQYGGTKGGKPVYIKTDKNLEEGIKPYVSMQRDSKTNKMNYVVLDKDEKEVYRSSDERLAKDYLTKNFSKLREDLEEQKKELEEQLKTAEKQLEELYIKEDKAYVIRFKRIKDKERMVVVFRNQHDADMYADNIKKQGGQVFSNKLEKIPYKVVDKK